MITSRLSINYPYFLGQPQQSVQIGGLFFHMVNHTQTPVNHTYTVFVVYTLVLQIPRETVLGDDFLGTNTFSQYKLLLDYVRI